MFGCLSCDFINNKVSYIYVCRDISLFQLKTPFLWYIWHIFFIFTLPKISHDHIQTPLGIFYKHLLHAPLGVMFSFYLHPLNMLCLMMTMLYGHTPCRPMWTDCVCLPYNVLVLFYALPIHFDLRRHAASNAQALPPHNNTASITFRSHICVCSLMRRRCHPALSCTDAIASGVLWQTPLSIRRCQLFMI